MQKNSINYDLLLENAMRDVVKQALKKATRSNDNNICFLFHIDTKYRGVVLPNYVKAEYADEITIILQHQFANLEVKSNSFSVDISFGGRMTNITIPFKSILIFGDQEAGVELRFGNYRFMEDEEAEEDDIEYFLLGGEEEEEILNNENNLISFDTIKKGS